MKAVVETGTDVAGVCFFDPAALPGDFSKKTRWQLLRGDRSLLDAGLIWYQDTGSDGGYLFHFYVDEEVPDNILQHCLDPQDIERFHVPGGVLWAMGAEYAGWDPAEAGLRKFPHMGGRFDLPAGDYRAQVWRTEWPDEMIEQAIQQRCDKRATAWPSRLGPPTGTLFLLTLFGTLFAGARTLAALGGAGWNVGLTHMWMLLGGAWLAIVVLFTVLHRFERAPERKAAERDFPSIVVQMQRISG